MQAIERLLARRARVRGRLPPFGELVRGSVFTRRMRCGKPTCRCVRGVLHRATYLGVSFAGGGAGPPREPPLLYTRREGTGMDLAEALLEVGPGRAEASFALFAQTLDPQWIDAALQATGAASVRRRKLPAEYVVWLVIGMGLLRDRSIEEVVRHLDLVLPGVDPPRRRPHVTGGAIVQARDRLGDQPLEALFATTAAQWAPASAADHRWHGLAVYGGGGSQLRG